MTSSLRIGRRSLLIGGTTSALLAAELGLGLVGCSDGLAGSTSGRRVRLSTRVDWEGAARRGFTNATGWEVTLEEATLWVNALLYLHRRPLLVRQRGGPLGRVFAIPSAHAHPGHAHESDVLGEVIGPMRIDLSTARLPDGRGVSGWARSGRVELGASGAGSAVAVSGRAVKGDLVRRFRLAAAPEELADVDGAIGGCAFEAGEMDHDGVVTLELRPSVWLDQVDFEHVPEPAGTPPPTDAGSARAAFVRGIKKASGYAFAYVPEEPA
ncbi:MAG TPA: hypothetical protein VKZ49_03240 [Polyangiaceae bacterium]|nr:hypothetical protein [Polyangiaceae bacterium]